MKPNVYFNFPVALLKDYWKNQNDFFESVMAYGMWYNFKDKPINNPREDIKEKHIKNYAITPEDYKNNYNHLCDIARMCRAEKYYGITIGNIHSSLKKGKELIDLYIETNPPYSNISKSALFDFYTKERTEWEHIVLLAFLGVRSIIGGKTYSKITFDYLFSRMAGERTKLKNMNDLPEIIKKYNTEYYKKKIREDLELGWHLKTVNGKGFYASFDLSQRKLTEAVKRKSRAYRLEKLKDEKEFAKDYVNNEILHESYKYRKNNPEIPPEDFQF